MPNQNLQYRMDSRNLQNFKDDIRKRTKKETFLANLIVKEWEYLGYKVQLLDNGTDNSGQFLTGRVSASPDYQAIVNSTKFLFDIKNSGVIHKCTFKLHNLKQYVKWGACILLFYGTGFIDEDPSQINYQTTMWGVIKPHKIAAMIQKYQPYKEPKFGNKLCIKCPYTSYNDFFASYPLQHIGAD